MIRPFKKGLAGLLLSALSLTAALAGCSSSGGDASSGSPAGGASPAASAQAADKYDKLPRELSVTAFDRGQVSSDEGSYESNRWTKWMEEQTGIKLKFVPVPRAQVQQKLNTLIAANEAPDIIWEYSRDYIGTLVTQGVLQPLDEYIDKYSKAYKKYLQDNPDLKPYLTFDGKTYAIAVKRSTNNIANGGMWIRQDWLDQVGMKAPATEDEFFAVLKAFRDKGLAKADAPLVSLHLSYANVLDSLFSAFSAQWYLENGKMTQGKLVDRTADAIAFERKLYANGYIDKEYLTDKNMQRSIQDWSSGKTGVFFATWSNSIENNMKDLLKNVPNANPVPLEPFATKYGKNGLYQETSPHMYVVFNKDMKNPKAAMEYLDWMLEKGWYNLSFGFENVHYKLVNGVPQVLDQEKFKKEVAYAYEYPIVHNNSSFFKPENLLVTAASDDLSQRWAKLQVESLKVALKNTFKRDIPYGPSIAEINNVYTAVKPKLDEIRTRAIVKGDISPQEALEMIRKEYKSAGGDKADQLAQEWYEKNKASFK